MECTACAGSIEKAVKRLPGIEDATVAVLQNRAQVVYRPAFVQVCSSSPYSPLCAGSCCLEWRRKPCTVEKYPEGR